MRAWDPLGADRLGVEPARGGGGPGRAGVGRPPATRLGHLEGRRRGAGASSRASRRKERGETAFWRGTAPALPPEFLGVSSRSALVDTGENSLPPAHKDAPGSSPARKPNPAPHARLSELRSAARPGPPAPAQRRRGVGFGRV
ncbi:hypothetical protein MC885_016750 [Smutsia gigantea]|nr:hypothetical protein MC885_016750 [Smutsia gigantea]